MSNVEIDQLRERLRQQEVRIGFIGAIGAEKSSFAQRISQRLGIGIVAGSHQENPYLDDFYSDPQRWSFQSQVWFLQDAVAHASESENNGAGFFVPALAMHTDVFARVQSEIMGWMDKKAFNTYNQLKEILHQEYPVREPDLYALIDAPFKVLTQRIKRRGRPYELRMLESFPEYLLAIQSYVRVWRRENPQKKVIVINSNNQNLSDEAALEEIELQMLNALSVNKQ